MTNTVALLIYLPILLVTLTMLPTFLTLRPFNKCLRYGVCFFACLLLWQALEVLFFISKNELVIRYAYDIKLIFVAFATVFGFLMLSEFYHLHNLLPRGIGLIISICPAITAIIAVTSPMHNLLFTHFELVTFETLTTVEAVRGPWFYVHLVHSELLFGYMAILVMANYRRMPPAYRKGTWYIIVAQFQFFGFTLLTFSGIGGDVIDFFLISSVVAGILYYLGMLANGRWDSFNINRREIFNYLDEGIFILSDDGMIFDMNHAAREIISASEDDTAALPFDRILDGFSRRGRLARRRLEDNIGEDLFFLGSQYPVVYHMRGHSIPGYGSKIAGKYVTLSNVTNKTLFLERLRETAGVDELTGLPNRHRFNEYMRDMDHIGNYPMSIILGDINGLKSINDSFGHQAGDFMLKHVADILKECCPEDCFAGRYGGDEFILVLPKRPKAAALEIARSIRHELSKLPDMFALPSIALGCATKTDPSENTNLLIFEADYNMYDDKGVTSP